MMDWTVLNPLPTQILYCAYSGGMDSQVLLHLLWHSPYRSQVKALHVNHHLSQHANQWMEHCQAYCASLGCPIEILHVQAAAPSGESPEEYARKLRYEKMVSLMRSNDVLLTAHHLEDQAETFMLQLMRGSGLSGLSAMPTLKQTSSGIWHFRPLLALEHAALLAYAKAQNLHWVHDESNDSLNFDRNYLRHQIFPLLKQRWPKASVKIAQSAKHISEAEKIIRSSLSNKFMNGVAAGRLSQSVLLSLPHEERAYLFRESLKQMACLMPSQKQLQQLMEDMLFSRPDAQPCFILDSCEIRRYQGEIFFIKKTKAPQLELSYRLPYPEGLPLPAVGRFSFCHADFSTETIALPSLSLPALSLRFRQGGERFHPQGRCGSHPLKKLFQEWKVPPWERARIPLLYLNDECLAVYLSDKRVIRSHQLAQLLAASQDSPLCYLRFDSETHGAQ